MKRLGFILFCSLFQIKTWGASAGSLLIEGYIAPYFEIKLLPEQRANQLRLNTGENNTIIASFYENSNSSQGYVVQISSKNGGTLNHETLSSSKIPYELIYNQQFRFTPSKTATLINQSGPLREVSHRLNHIGITLNGNSQLPAGTYSDTITIEMISP